MNKNKSRLGNRKLSSYEISIRALGEEKGYYEQGTKDVRIGGSIHC